MKVGDPIPCPFCSGRIEFPLDEAERASAVLHTMPPCAKFMNTEDALAFVKACNVEVAARRGVGLT